MSSKQLYQLYPVVKPFRNDKTKALTYLHFKNRLELPETWDNSVNILGILENLPEASKRHLELSEAFTSFVIILQIL